MLPRNLQSLMPETQIELFDLFGFKLQSNPADLFPDVFRFCNFSEVVWRETPSATPNAYIAIGCESEGYDLTGQGSLPQPKVTISNVGRTLANFLFELKYNPAYRLEGATIVRHLTQVNFLENGPDRLQAARELPPQIYQIEQLEEETPSAVRLVLSSPFDLDGATLPNRPALRTCPYLYRDTETCKYTGTAMFTRANQPTSTAQQDICNKSLTACELRFSTGLVRFGGFPGLGGL